jgi:DNA (cytosine-5)-methyltransferase 1
VQAFLIKFYGTGGQLAGCDEPMHTLPTKDRMGLVTVHGQDYVIADIGMRMLQPRELARAQGFGEDYLLEAPHAGKTLPKHAQVRMVGNSVCPPMAEVLVRANFVEHAALREAA